MEQNLDFGWVELLICIGFTIVMSALSILIGYLKAKATEEDEYENNK